MIHTYSYKVKNTGLARALAGFQSSGLTKHFYFEDFNNIPDLDKCDVAIFGNCLPIQLKDVKHPNKGYLFCSGFGQADLSTNEHPSAEISVLYGALYYRSEGDIQFLISTNERVAKIHNMIWTPDSIMLDKDPEPVQEQERPYYGFLGNNLRKHRNFHNQIVAMSMLPRKPVLINQMSFAHELANAFYGVQFEKKELSDQEYFDLIPQQIISFQASYSETFNYMALEYALRGVPTVVCPDTGHWYPIKDCIVGNVDDPFNIGYIADRMIKNEKYWKICGSLQHKAKKVNKERQDIMKKAIEEIDASRPKHAQ